MSCRRVLSVVMWSLALLVPVVSQQDDLKTKPAKTKTAAIREAKRLRTTATSLLYTLAQSGNEIDSVPERVMVISEVGDALWSVDQDYARSILIRSFQEIAKLRGDADRDSEDLASQIRALRRAVLSRIAKHDPELAGQLMRNLPVEPPTADEKAMRRYGITTPMADALLGIAQNLLASDPKKAATLAAYSLQDGLSQRLRLFLLALRAKDQAAADSLVDAALKQASTQHPAQLFDVLMLWDYTYQPKSFYLDGISWEREPDELVYRSSPALKRAALQFAVSAIIENLRQLPAPAGLVQDARWLPSQQAGLVYSVIQQLLPSMQADWPSGAVDLQQALARIERELEAAGQKPPERPEHDSGTSSPESMVDALLEKAGAASQGEGRDSLFLDASFKLFQMGKYERAADVAAKIDDLDRRSMLMDPINFRLACELVEKSNLNDALTVARRLKAPELRIDALSRVGSAFAAKGDPQGQDILYEAQSAVNKADQTLEVAAATLRIAGALIKTDQIRAAEVMRVAIQIANQEKDDQRLWSLMTTTYPDPLSFIWKNAPQGGLQSVDVSYASNGGLRHLLSKLDFEVAVVLAKGVKSKAFSLGLQAAICRAAIESTQAKTSVARS